MPTAPSQDLPNDGGDLPRSPQLEIQAPDISSAPTLSPDVRSPSDDDDLADATTISQRNAGACSTMSAGSPLPAFASPDASLGSSPNNRHRRFQQLQQQATSHHHHHESTSGSHCADGTVDPTAFMTSHGVMPSKWIRDLPCIIRGLIIYCYCELLRPDDDFRQELRKIVLVMGPVLSACASSALLVNWFTIDHDDTSAAGIVARFNTAIMVLTWWGCYFVCRATGRASERLCDGWLLGTWLALTLTMISFPDFPSEFSFMLLLIIAMLARTSWLPLHAVICLLNIAACSYNTASYARGEPEVPLVAFPSAFMRGLWIRMMFSATNYGSIIFVLAGLQLQMLESDRQTARAKANSDVALELAERLGVYDTKKAAKLIDAGMSASESADNHLLAGAEDATADPKLLRAFHILVSNLNKYRPHLPNWLLIATTTTDEEEEDDPDLAVDLADLVAASPTFGDHNDSASVSNAASPNMRSPAAKRASPGGVASPKAGRARAREQQQADSSSSGPIVVLASGIGGFLSPNVCKPTRATVAVVHYGIGRDSKLSNTRVAEAVSALVDRVHELAKTTGGAVHSFVGDVVMLSWNAASRAVQAETKAARFLLRLRDDPGHQDAAVGGAVFAGRARVQLAGSGASAALTLHAKWFPALNTLARFGAAAATFVADGSVKSEIEHAVRTRCITAFSVRDWRDNAASAATNNNAAPRGPFSVAEAMLPPASGGAFGGAEAALASPPPSSINPAQIPPARHGSFAGANSSHATPNSPARPNDVGQRYAASFSGVIDSEGTLSALVPALPPRVVVAYELLMESADANGGDDEWMYVLEQEQKADAPSPMSKATAGGGELHTLKSPGLGGAPQSPAIPQTPTSAVRAVLGRVAVLSQQTAKASRAFSGSSVASGSPANRVSGSLQSIQKSAAQLLAIVESKSSAAQTAQDMRSWRLARLALVQLRSAVEKLERARGGA